MKHFLNFQPPEQRFLRLLEVSSLADARQQLLKNNSAKAIDVFTVIDTTTDFNQNKWLGSELGDTLIYINPATRINGLLAVSGCVKGGCQLVFAFEHGEYCGFYRDFFLPKLRVIARLENTLMEKTRKVSEVKSQCASQTEVLQTLLKHSSYAPLHLVGERGTGKSTLLGCYILHLCKNKNHRVLLLSPSRSASKNSLKYLKDVSRETFLYKTVTGQDKEALAWATHIIVDEAATVHRAVIEILYKLKPSPYLVFATTIDGYEGTGQSYRLSYLNQKAGKVIYLDQPKRFCPKDPFYLLSKQLCQPQQELLTTDLTDGIWVFSSEEMQDNNLMLAAFSLLREAHYRSTPNDLAAFYSQSAYFVVVISNHQLIAATYALKETLPTQDDTSISAVINGQRRIKNALTHQSILYAYGDNCLANHSLLRISRIAVAANKRRQGIATAMLVELSKYAQSKGAAFLSTAFSGQADTLAFWCSQDFVLARIGLSKNKWHNSYSLLMVKSLNHCNHGIEKTLLHHFQRHYTYYQKAYKDQDKATVELLEKPLYPTFEDTVKPLAIEHNWSLSGGFSTTVSLSQAIDSVTLYHRDIHWVLPRLKQWLQGQVLPIKLTSELLQLLDGQFLNKTEKAKANSLLLNLRQHLLFRNNHQS